MPLIPRIISANTKAPPCCSALPDSACARPSTDQAASLPVAPRQPFQKAPTRKPQRRTHFQNPPFPLNKNVPPQIHEAPLRQGLPGKRHLRNHLSVIGGISASPAKRDCPQGCPLACLLSSRPNEARSVSGLSVSTWRPDSALPTVHLFQVPSSDRLILKRLLFHVDEPTSRVTASLLWRAWRQKETAMFGSKVNKSNSLSPPRFDTTNSPRLSLCPPPLVPRHSG